MNKITKIIVPIVVLGIILILGLSVAPFNNPLKSAFNSTFNKIRYGSALKNFSSTILEDSGTKVVKISDSCSFAVKYDTSKLKNVDQPALATNVTTVTLFKPDNNDNSAPDLQFICISLDEIIDKFRENVIAIWEKNDKLKEQFNISIEDAKKLSRRDFYKLYTAKVTSNCKSETDYNSIKFLHNDIINKFMSDYNKCTYDNVSANKNIVEHYFFPSDDTQSVLFVRSINNNDIADNYLVVQK